MVPLVEIRRQNDLGTARINAMDAQKSWYELCGDYILVVLCMVFLACSVITYVQIQIR